MNVWHGKLDSGSDELEKNLSAAVKAVDNVIFLSGYTVDTVPDVFKERVFGAVCAQADYFYENGGINDSASAGEFGSVSLGSFSYSGAVKSSGGNSSGGGSSPAAALAPSILSGLLPTGLLYKGISL